MGAVQREHQTAQLALRESFFPQDNVLMRVLLVTLAMVEIARFAIPHVLRALGK